MIKYPDFTFSFRIQPRDLFATTGYNTWLNYFNGRNFSKFRHPNILFQKFKTIKEFAPSALGFVNLNWRVGLAEKVKPSLEKENLASVFHINFAHSTA